MLSQAKYLLLAAGLFLGLAYEGFAQSVPPPDTVRTTADTTYYLDGIFPYYLLPANRSEATNESTEPVSSAALPIEGGTGLGQNFPNPVRRSTTIPFKLEEAGEVTISVLNLLGKPVATIVRGQYTAGQHNVLWQVKDIPPGIYFYELKTTAGVFTRKMTLMR